MSLIFSRGRKKFVNNFRKLLQDPKRWIIFAAQFKGMAVKLNCFGALVQLVRIHACHAWGHGFESRTHRNKY